LIWRSGPEPKRIGGRTPPRRTRPPCCAFWWRLCPLPVPSHCASTSRRPAASVRGASAGRCAGAAPDPGGSAGPDDAGGPSPGRPGRPGPQRLCQRPGAALPEDRGLGDHGGIRHPRGGQGRYPRGEPAAPKGAGNATRGAHHSRQDSCSDYRAQDHSLLLWVHGSLIDALLTAYRAVVGDLSDARADRFVRECDAVANLMGLPPGSTWSSKLEMRSWIGRQVRLGWCSPAADRAGW
jgi:hypothetical protein